MKDWPLITIGDCFDFKNGLNKEKEYFGHGNPIINYMDVYKSSSICADDLKGKVELSDNEIRRYEVRKGDVFFTRTSETPEEVGLASVLLEDVENCTFSGFVLRARPKNDWLLPEYCKYCFSTEFVRKSIVEGCTYTTRALTNGTQLSKIQIPLPSKQEQQAIVKTLSDFDKLISTQENLIAKKQTIKQGTVQELLSGKKRLLGFKEKWVKRRLGDVGTLLRMSVNPQQHPNDKFYEYSMPSYDEGKKPKFVNGETMNSLRYKIPHNILLFNKLNVRQKRVWLIEEELPNSVCSTEFLPYKANEIDLYLLREMLIQDEVVDYFESISTGTSNSQKRISPQNFLDYEVLMPFEIDEQRALSLLLKDINEEIDVLKGKLRKLHQIKTGVMDNLLTGKIRLTN